MFKAVCPHCFQEYSLDDALLGKTASCKRCRNVFTLERSSVMGLTSTQGPAFGGTSPRPQPGDDSGFELRPPTGKENTKSGSETTNTPKPAKRFAPESGMWNVGDLVLGLYEVKPLSDKMYYAEGGMGVVNRVYHREWDMDLAVKSPKPHVFQTEGGKLVYEKEAQTWIELGLHPNIVTCYLVRRISNIPRLFAEFVPDGSLRDWITDGRLYEGGPEAALLRIMNIAIQFAWGLEHAHRQKLLHLDVKPGNVMMAGQTAKVTDFGLARSIVDDQGTANGSGDISVSTSGDARGNGPASESSAGNRSSVHGNTHDGIDGNAGDNAGGNLTSRPVHKSGISSITVASLTPGYCSPEQFLAYRLAPRREFEKMPKITFQSDIWSWAVSVLAMFHGRAPCKKGGQTARKVLELFLNRASIPTRFC